VSFTPRPLDPGYPLKQKAGLALEPGWTYLTTEECLWPSLGREPRLFDCPSRSVVTVLTEYVIPAPERGHILV
jgi:hypothetical protein